MGCGSSKTAVAVSEPTASKPAVKTLQLEVRANTMGCGSSKTAVGVSEPTASKPAAGKQEDSPVKAEPLKPRQPSQTPPLKIGVRFEDTGLRTGCTLSGWDQDDSQTVEDIAKMLVSGHITKLKQLGFDGAALVLFDSNSAVRPPRQRIAPEELALHTDKNPLRIGRPPQWTPDAVRGAQDLRIQTGATELSTPRQGMILCSALTATTASQGSAERIMLSPRSKAYRAEIAALAKRNSAQHKTPVYTPNEKFVEIKRDMHSHLKKDEAKEEPSHQPPSEEEVNALQKPTAVASQQNAAYQLEALRVKELAMQLVGFMSKYRDKDKQALLKDLKSFLEPESWEELRRQSRLGDSAWSGQVLYCVCACICACDYVRM